jgi:hypothetical protein
MAPIGRTPKLGAEPPVWTTRLLTAPRQEGSKDGTAIGLTISADDLPPSLPSMGFSLARRLCLVCQSSCR